MFDVTDIRPAIVPKSDQLNAEQLLSGPLTITLTNVTASGTAEQPYTLHYEGDNGRPYKPCKTMLRVLDYGWGSNALQWIGRSLTLYNLTTVKWGKEEVGGIRISHMSDIEADFKLALTVTRGKKEPHHIKRMDPPQTASPTLASVLELIPKIKGQKTKATVEAMIQALPFEDQMQATEALEKQVAALRQGA